MFNLLLKPLMVLQPWIQKTRSILLEMLRGNEAQEPINKNEAPPLHVEREREPINENEALPLDVQPMFTINLMRLLRIVALFEYGVSIALIVVMRLYYKDGFKWNVSAHYIAGFSAYVSYILAIVLLVIYQAAREDPSTKVFVRMIRVAFVVFAVDTPLLIFVSWVTNPHYLYIPLYLIGFFSAMAVLVGGSSAFYYYF